MLTDRMRLLSRGVVTPVAAVLGRLGLTPNMLTLVGAGLHLGVAGLLAQGHLTAGAVALAVAAALDGLDGALARATGRSSVFGAFLDSTMDRLSEVLVFLGLLVYAQQVGLATEGRLALLALAGSLMVSYTRARSEGLGCGTRAGLFGRLERMVVLVLGLLVGQLALTLWVVTVGAWLTTGQRIFDVWRQSTPSRSDA